MINTINMLLLMLTITLSAGRNMLSGKVSKTGFGNKTFYRLQGSIFAAGAAALLIFTDKNMPEPLTVCLAVLYTLCLILAQWCYTIALSKIKVSICSTIYSLGFVIPTLSGSIFWKENFTLFDFMGMCCVVLAVIVSGKNKESTEDTHFDKRYFIALVTAMLASGGLGLIQKLQQSLPHSEEKDIFVTLSFVMASLVSYIFSLFAKKNKNQTHKRQFVYASLTGICFGMCNLLNTTLAGRLNSSLFFPLQNISVILLSIILSRVINKEKFTQKTAVIFTLGAAAIILLNIPV